MDVKNMFLERGRFSVQDGAKTRFWEDLWLGDEPLMTKYASLYNIARKKNVTKYASLYNIARKKNVSVAQVLSTEPLNISFRRAVIGENRVKRLELVGGLLEVRLNSQRDTFIWNGSKTFSVRSMYNDIMTRVGIPLIYRPIKLRCPYKLKFSFDF
jgi:hypothetical protein